MINAIWFAMLLAGAITAARQGNIEIITEAALRGAEQAVTVAFSLIGIVAFWSGLLRIAEKAGLIQLLGYAMRPVASLLFPDLPRDHPAMGAIVLSMSANLLGLGTACTPLGLKAMEELQQLNTSPEQASNSMCTYVALTTSSLTLIPGTVIAFRVAQNSQNPTEIIAPTILATLVSTLVAIAVDRIMRRFF